MSYIMLQFPKIIYCFLRFERIQKRRNMFPQLLFHQNKTWNMHKNKSKCEKVDIVCVCVLKSSDWYCSAATVQITQLMQLHLNWIRKKKRQCKRDFFMFWPIFQYCYCTRRMKIPLLQASTESSSRKMKISQMK